MASMSMRTGTLVATAIVPLSSSTANAAVNAIGGTRVPTASLSINESCAVNARHVVP
jgi:hypothetical protein